ncbi:hypothetical protein D1872_280820 [compost metagenome]
MLHQYESLQGLGLGSSGNHEPLPYHAWIKFYLVLHPNGEFLVQLHRHHPGFQPGDIAHIPAHVERRGRSSCF